MLIEQRADVDKSDDAGQTPLIWAAKAGQVDVVGLLIEEGADVDKSDHKAARR